MSLTGSLEQPLNHEQRSALQGELTALLAWQRDLQRWTAPSVPASLAPAMPIVSLYAGATLCGCFAWGSGPGQQRVARAFLAALGDARFPSISDEQRARLVAQVAYPLRARRIDPSQVTREFAPGVHGLALLHEERGAVILVPDVARDLRLNTDSFVRVLEEKAGLSRAGWSEHELYAFETERVVARAHEPSRQREQPLLGALQWLAQQVESDGRVRFGSDAKTGAAEFSGFLRHARSASVVQALALDSRFDDVTERARAWLGSELERAQSGNAIGDWPSEVAHRAATFSLCCLAGVDARAPLRGLALEPALLGAPWHAAQAVAALGSEAPPELWQACIAALEVEPFAPWTAIAAHRRGDSATFERAIRALITQVPLGDDFGFVGEPAPAGLTIEALSLATDSDARAAQQASLELLRRCQLWSDNDPAENSAWIHGAFPLIRNEAFLRCDATAHAAIALASEHQ